MTIRQEISNYLNDIPDNKLYALKPILEMLASETLLIETNLTLKEKSIIKEGREEYSKGSYIPLAK
ncbi:MAG: hypothetical protein LBT20_04120 [Clostridiales bacterium]|jgi:hypothetical protein|nr:hypothetical protein [Clostridiales bacterium]